MVSLGRIGLALAGGAAKGASDIIDKREKKVEKEIERRDRLFQQAMRYAEEDRTKYEAARKNKQEMLSLALEDVRSMGLADDSQTQMVLAANMVKEAGSKEALTNRLEKLREDFAVSPDVVRGGFTPLTSNLDKETLRNVTFDTLTEQLVPSYQRGKGLGSYYQPSPFESKGFFKGIGREDIAQQEEQFRQTAEAFGLGKRDIGELPSVGALPSRLDITEVASSTTLRAQGFAKRAQAEKTTDPNIAKTLREEADSLINRANAMDEEAALAKKTGDDDRTPVNVSQLTSMINAVKANPIAYHSTDKAMYDVLSLEAQRGKEGVSQDVRRSTEYQYIYSAFANAKMKGINTKEQLQNLQFAQSSFEDIENNPMLNTAFAYRGGSTQKLTTYLNTLKSIDTTSEQFKSLPRDVQKLAVFIRDNDTLLDKDVEKAKQKRKAFKGLLDPLLKNGYFVPESSLRAYNPDAVFLSAFGKPVPSKSIDSTKTPNTDSKTKINPNKMVDPNAKEEINKDQKERFAPFISKALEQQRQRRRNAIEKEIKSIEKDMKGWPAWSRTREGYVKRLEDLKTQLRELENGQQDKGTSGNG